MKKFRTLREAELLAKKANSKAFIYSNAEDEHTLKQNFTDLINIKLN